MGQSGIRDSGVPGVQEATVNRPDGDNPQTRGLFVTGTDTGVGKTRVAALIARESCAAGRRVGAYKPACSGSEIDADGLAVFSDIDSLWQATGRFAERERICPQRFQAPVAPPVAARLEEREVDSSLLRSGAAWWQGRVEMLVVEGVGGLCCPLSSTETVADLAADLGFPLVIVVRLRLGCINHTLLTVEVARARGIPLAGIVLNEVDPPSAEFVPRDESAEISSRTGVPVLGVIAHNRRDRLIRRSGGGRIDWWELAARSNSR